LGEGCVEAPDLVLDGPLDDARALRGVTGTARAALAADLARVAALLPEGTSPFARVSGTIAIDGEISKPARGEAPDTRLRVRTRDLAFALRPDPRDAARTPLAVEGVDLDATLRREHTRTELTLRAL